MGREEEEGEKVEGGGGGEREGVGERDMASDERIVEARD